VTRRAEDIAGFEFVPDEPGGRIYRHVATSIPFQLLPGGTLRRGLSEAEEAALRGALEVVVDDDAAAGLDFLDGAALLRPASEVTLAPFLLTPRPLDTAQLAALLGADAPPDPGPMANCLPQDVAERVVIGLAGQGLRLPSEAEWEYAYRAGSRGPFPWGVDRPETPWAPENAFGLEGMGEFAELCADGWLSGHDDAPLDGSARNPGGRPRVARGGAAEVWPWQDVGEWVTLLSAYRSPADEHEGFLRIRAAYSP